MRDWYEYVRSHLDAARFDRTNEENVTREIAGHLEEHYQTLRLEGQGEEQAFLNTCNQVGNWKDLSKVTISERQEVAMTDRVKQIWIPSLLTLLVSWTILALLIWKGPQPWIWYWGASHGVILYPPWLAALPFIGAAGAYLSRNARGNGWRVYLSGTFPAVAAAAIFALTLPSLFFVDSKVVPGVTVSSLSADIFSWLVLPGIALYAGVAVQGFRKSQTPTEN
jgi:hypothetical protein